MHRFAAILTHNRPDLLRETWCAIGPQVDMVFIIDNASNPPVNPQDYAGQEWRSVVVHVPDQPPNLSRLWNLAAGLAITIAGREPFEPEPLVAVLCDDAPPPEGWFEAVAGAMRGTGAVLGCSAPQPFDWQGDPIIKRVPDSDLARRLTGWAWVLDPVSTVRADERFEWWWGDTDLDWTARAAGGTVIIGTHPVPNVRPNDFSGRPAQAAQIAADSQRFVDKHGWRPW